MTIAVERNKSFFVILLCFCVFVLLIGIFSSCNSSKPGKNQSTGLNPALREAITRADRYWEKGDTVGCFNILDSAYHKLTQPGIIDKYWYYTFYNKKYSRIPDNEKSLKYVDSSLALFEGVKITKELSQLYANANYDKGDRLLFRGDNKDASPFFYKARSVAKENNDSCTLAYYDNRVGIILYRGGRYADALRKFKLSFEEFHNCSDLYYVGYKQQEMLDNIALCYYHLAQFDSALIYYDKTLQLIDKITPVTEIDKKDCEVARGVVYGNMGSVYMAIDSLAKAELLFIKSININDKKEYAITDAQLTKAKLGLLYLKVAKYPQVSQLTESIGNYLLGRKDKKVELQLNNLLWNYYSAINESDNAYRYLLRYTILKDSMDKSELKSEPLDFNDRIMAMEGESIVDEMKKKEELRILYLFIAALVCLTTFAIAFLIYRNWNVSKKHIEELTKLNAGVNEQKDRLEIALDKLSKSDKEKDRILKAVSHDMRSPVHSAMALTDLILSEKDNLTQEQIGYLDLIKDSCSNAISLTRDLLEIVTMHSEAMTKEQADICALAKTTVELLRFKASEKNQTINLTIPQMPLILTINKEKIARVINNLVTNAIKFSKSGADIHVKLDIDSDGTRLSVADNGIGIPDDLKNKIFDLFTEAKRYGTSGEQPYGLGLSISRQIVEAHNGRIWFESIVGNGTTFYVYVPTTFVA